MHNQRKICDCILFNILPLILFHQSLLISCKVKFCQVLIIWSCSSNLNMKFYTFLFLKWLKLFYKISQFQQNFYNLHSCVKIFDNKNIISHILLLQIIFFDLFFLLLMEFASYRCRPLFIACIQLKNECKHLV